MSYEEALEVLSDDEVIADMAWVLRDWEQAATWLTKYGAPTELENGMRPTLIERIKWVAENVETTTLVGD